MDKLKNKGQLYMFDTNTIHTLKDVAKFGRPTKSVNSKHQKSLCKNLMYAKQFSGNIFI